MARSVQTQQHGQPYFVDQKKGEVNELRALLGKLTVQRDKTKLREVLKKVIAYMTLGIDVTRLFDQMVMASHTSDLVVKKMVYLYLTHYAAANPNLAILGINTLCKDAGDADPMVRGLAIRSLTSLRLISVIEYVVEPIRKGLTDTSSYVRKAAVMGVLKIHHLDPGIVQDSDFVNQLYNTVRDPDAKVVTNCLVVLNEIMREEGGVAINKKLITYLLNRIGDFDEWGQTIVLDLVPKYTPTSDQEAFAFMNVLDGCLRTSNSAVALATTKCFIHFTETLGPEIRNQAFRRIKSPLMTLMTGGCLETSWIVLKHVSYLVKREQGIFDEHFKAFYCKHNDPMHVQFIKLEILSQVANTSQMAEVVAELSEYAMDITNETSRRAINSIAKVAMRIPTCADSIINQLLGFLDLNIEHVTDQTMVALKNTLRKYPGRGAEVSAAVGTCMGKLKSPAGRAAVVWMLGEFGSIIPEAPYLIETVADNVESEPRTVRLELLSAVLKLFFQRAPEMQAMLGRLMFFFSHHEDLEPDLNDRVAFYHRLMQTNPQKCAAVIMHTRDVVSAFTEEQFNSAKESLFRQFNTLAIVYGLPANKFTDENHTETSEERSRDEARTIGVVLAPGSQTHDHLAVSSTAGDSSSPPGATLDLLDNMPDECPVNKTGQLRLHLGSLMSKADFQRLWTNSTVTENQLEFTFQSGNTLLVQTLEYCFEVASIRILASGHSNGLLKMYLYGRTLASTDVYLCELNSDRVGMVHGTVKVSTDSLSCLASDFVVVLKSCLSNADHYDSDRKSVVQHNTPETGLHSEASDIMGLF